MSARSMAVRAALVLSVLSVALATGYAAGAAAAGAGTGTDALALADPGVFSLELGGFNSLEDVLAVESDDVWAVGDGIVHYSAGEWSQVAGMEGPAFHAIDGFSSDALWAVGEVRDVGCDRYGIVMRRDAVGWHSEPVGSHQPLFDVAMVSETEGWAVGGIDVPVILHYDGERWSEVGAPETGGLFAVHLTSARSGWAVGDRGAIVRFDGRDWIAARSPTYSRLLDVHMLDEETGWAVGEGNYSQTGIILAYEDGEWVVDLEDQTPVLGAVLTLGPNTAVATGLHGVLLHFDGDRWREIGRTYPGGYVPYTVDGSGPEGGGTWSEGDGVGPEGGGAESGGDGVGPDGNGAWPAAGDLVVVSATGPQSRLADATARRDRVLHSGRIPAALDGAAEPEGAVEPDDATKPDGATEPDGGGMPAPPGGYGFEGAGLRGLGSMPDAETVLAVGDAGQIVLVDDRVWSEVHYGRQLEAIDMRSVDDGWAVGPDGLPLHWDGSRWSAHTIDRRARDLNDVAVPGAGDAWAVGDHGAVAHWDGAAWSLWPKFTSADLDAVSFSAPDDGWTIANIYDELMGTIEARVFHWDGREWSQAFRLCHGYLVDVASRGPNDVWLAASGDAVLHFDGTDWAWHPVLGADRPDDYGATVRRIALTEHGGWGVGSGLASLDGGTWRTVPTDASWPWLEAFAIDHRDGLWGLAEFSEYTDNILLSGDSRYGTRVVYWPGAGQLGIAHEQVLDLRDLDAVVDAAGRTHVWVVGGASTIVHYTASAPGAVPPEPTATPRLPAPDPYPTPTPRSSLRPDEIAESILDDYDHDGELGLRVIQVELLTVADVEDRLAHYLGDDYTQHGWRWRWREPVTCHSWRPVWLALVEGDWSGVYSNPGSLAVFILDGATGWEEVVLFVTPIRGRLHLPLVVGGGGREYVYPTRPPRELTPEVIKDVAGPCPTMTPYPTSEGPPGAYPGPAQRD